MGAPQCGPAALQGGRVHGELRRTRFDARRESRGVRATAQQREDVNHRAILPEARPGLTAKLHGRALQRPLLRDFFVALPSCPLQCLCEHVRLLMDKASQLTDLPGEGVDRALQIFVRRIESGRWIGRIHRTRRIRRP